uniref:Uncharacterized protein n=1 Tax=Metallosphaera hakonensis JCM 8857 = DSM 7519 TaxID=1293036 RepID=A0A2U9IWA6_9CREN
MIVIDCPLEFHWYITKKIIHPRVYHDNLSFKITLLGLFVTIFVLSLVSRRVVVSALVLALGAAQESIANCIF